MITHDAAHRLGMCGLSRQLYLHTACALRVCHVAWGLRKWRRDVRCRHNLTSDTASAAQIVGGAPSGVAFLDLQIETYYDTVRKEVQETMGRVPRMITIH